jgi:hypothetical protein
MKNTTDSVKKETQAGAPVASDRQDENFPQWEEVTRKPRVDPFDCTLLGNGIPNYVIDPSSLENANFPPIDDPATLELLDMAAKIDDKMRSSKQNVFHDGVGTTGGFDPDAAWIQTYSGRRFCPTNPNPDAIVIQDIAHSLSMQCRFTGHTKKFYSVAQHSVYVSHICNEEDALWGLLHDASEAYLTDVPRPLKRSGHFSAYIEFEARMQAAICKRFGLPIEEPPSVKKADAKLLATESRDLMAPLHKDWIQRVSPLPFTVEAWDQQKAKDMFMQRFYELIGADPSNYEHYLRNKDVL